jgi:hypothetical protein
MRARQLQIKTVFHYTIGRVYQLDDLQDVVVRLKTISSRQVGGSIFHLYREKGTHQLWMEGPFKGPGSSGFMYLGERETKSQFEKFLFNEFKSMLQDFVVKSADLLSGRAGRQESVLPDYDQLLFFDLERW